MHERMYTLATCDTLDLRTLPAQFCVCALTNCWITPTYGVYTTQVYTQRTRTGTRHRLRLCPTTLTPSPSLFSLCVYMYVCVMVHMYTRIHACVCIWKPDHIECPIQSLLILLESGLLLSLAAGEPQPYFSPQPHPALGLQVLRVLLGFSQGCWGGLNSGMHTHTAYALPFPHSQSSCMTSG